MSTIFEYLLAFAVLVGVLLILRYALWSLLGWLGMAWDEAPGVIEKGARLSRADRIGKDLADRFPRLADWLRARVDRHRFSGLPLTLIILAGFYAIFLLAGLVEAVLESEGIRTFDEMVIAVLDPLRTEEMMAVFGWLTGLGALQTLTAVAIVASGFMMAHGPGAYILPLWLTVVGSQITTYLGKFILGLPRPDTAAEISAATPSFPSGHTTGAMAVYGIIAYALLRDEKSARVSFEVAYWTGVLIVLVSFSRIFLSAHFTSDVLAGILVGGFWLLAGIALAELRRGSKM